MHSRSPPERWISETVTVSTPEQHRPPVYACAAGAVLHAHSADTLEPAVLLYTFLPSGGGDRIDALEAKVDVHGDGPGSSTLTVRVLADGQSLSWQLPIAPFVAALPGQPGDDGRMVLLAVMDAEPDEGFWAQPVDCERLAAELQLPVTDLADALRGRLTPWLADDVDLLLHDDAHEHAADLSPAQTLANAVLAHYRGDLEAEQASTRLLRAFDYAPKDFQAELGARLCVALATAVVVAGPAGVATVLEQTGPFEPEVTRLLTELPPHLRPDDPQADDPETTADVVLSATETGEAIKAAVTAIARLARACFGESEADEEVLRRLSMVSDAGQARLATLWVDLAVATAGDSDTDTVVASDLATRVHAEGAPAGAWLRTTAATLGAYALELTGRSASRVAAPLKAVDAFLTQRPRAGDAMPAELAAGALRNCLALARFVRTRGGIGPGEWRQVPVESAAQAVGTALARGLARSTRSTSSTSCSPKTSRVPTCSRRSCARPPSCSSRSIRTNHRSCCRPGSRTWSGRSPPDPAAPVGCSWPAFVKPPGTTRRRRTCGPTCRRNRPSTSTSSPRRPAAAAPSPRGWSASKPWRRSSERASESRARAFPGPFW